MVFKDMPYTCRFCGSARVAQYDDGCPTLNLDKWKQLVACDRCCAYHIERRRLAHRIGLVCSTIEIAKGGRKFNGQLESDTREKLQWITKDIAKLVCDYHNLQTVWEPDFIQQLVDRPDMCDAIIKSYYRGVEGLRRAA